MTNPKLFTTEDQSRIVSPIMKMLGISRDGVWCKDGDNYYHYSQEEWVECEYSCALDRGDVLDIIASYRLDKLMLALPEWCAGIFDFEFLCAKFDDLVFARKLHEIGCNLRPGRGPEAIAACVELIVLLDKEGLL